MENYDEILDPYFVSYYMNNASLQYENIFDKLSKSLYLAKLYFKSDGILLYKYNNDNYELYNNTPYLNMDISVVNKIIDNKNINFNSEQKINLNDQNITFLPISFRDTKYVLAVINGKYNKNIDIIMNTLKIILDKMELYQDGLTHLDNRMAFTNKVNHYNQTDKHVTFVILDLFRLKFVNDNCGHIIGDLYIKKAADIIKKYFSKYNYSNKSDLSSKNETGDNIYRIGGDEFVVISENKSYEEVSVLLEQLANEVKNLNLGMEIDSPIGINYGISERNNNESLEELYKISDERLSDDKRRMYEELNINRRK